MEFTRPLPELIPYGLRALKAVAPADGVFDVHERGLLQTAQSVFGAEHDLDALAPIEPAELAARITEPRLRKQLLRAMVMVSLIDGEASPRESALVDRFAAALGVESPDLKVLRHLADKHLVRARFDLARRFFAREKLVEAVQRQGVGWLAGALATMAGLREDAALTAKYRALGALPAGTLGRGYYDFITGNKFSFPGEKGSPPEPVTLHDFTHVLSGYGTDPEGELQVLAFHTGARREEKDPFGFLLFGVAEFHLGIAMTPIAKGSRMALDPAKLFAALQRGIACKVDPTENWDPWPLMERNLDALRAEYNISPLPAA